MNTKIDNKVRDILKTKYEEGSNTFKVYYNSFKKIHLLLGDKKSFAQYKKVNDVEKVINENVKSDNSRKSIYNYLKVVLSEINGYKRISKD